MTTEGQIFDEDYGLIRMERFKNQCRQILGQKNKYLKFDEEEEDEEY